jgi:predicted polyphosphate/ATP-dependent NAD kinase
MTSHVGTNNITLVGALHKLGGLNCLRVDTGELELDEMFYGNIKVTVGCGEGMLREVR